MNWWKETDGPVLNNILMSTPAVLTLNALIHVPPATNTGSEHDSSNTTTSGTLSSIDLDSFLRPEVHKPPSFTFKIVGDKLVKPRDMRSDYKA